ncbi:methyltransferase domain-containing protein [Flavobacteriaceae bacterium D16]|nr:methyltransferase domain-containing protein [Flavobacteriaceae bacterium D16]
MKKTVLIIFLGTLLACQGQEHKKDHDPGTANEYMHQSSVEDLAKRFESPERDAYQKPEKVLAFFGDISGKKIMDIGAGSGYFSVKLAKKGAHVIAADVNDEFQVIIKERIDTEKLENLTTRKIPYDSPGLEDKEVDMVLMVNTYHHIENRPDYFAKVKNGLKNKGELVIIDFYDADIPVGPRHHKIPIDTVISELKKAGYTHFEVEVNLLPYQYIIRCKLD